MAFPVSGRGRRGWRVDAARGASTQMRSHEAKTVPQQLRPEPDWPPRTSPMEIVGPTSTIAAWKRAASSRPPRGNDGGRRQIGAATQSPSSNPRSHIRLNPLSGRGNVPQGRWRFVILPCRKLGETLRICEQLSRDLQRRTTRCDKACKGSRTAVSPWHTAAAQNRTADGVSKCSRRERKILIVV